jgi:hypothetical protein
VRSFQGPRAVDLDFTRPDGSYAGWTVLAGRNGSGKTSVLRAIALSLLGERRAVQLDDELEDRLSVGRAEGRITTTVAADPKTDGIATKSTRATEPTFTFDATVRWAPDDALPLFSYPGDAPAPTQVHFQGPSLRTPLWRPTEQFGWFLAGYGPFRRLAAAGLYRRASKPSDARVAAVRTLFHEQAALTEAVDWLVALHLYRYEEDDRDSTHYTGHHAAPVGARQLIDTILALLDDGLLPDGYRVVRVDSEGLWLRRHDTELPLRRMSDGYRTVVAMVLDIVRRMHAAYGSLNLEHAESAAGRIPVLLYPGVVLIDEVDAHLHVSWQSRIGDWLKEHFPAVQFIVTTHSPYVCQAADANGLIRLPGPEEEASPHVVDEELYGRVVYGTGDDAVVSELFGVDEVYSPRALALRAELVESEFAVMIGAADEAQRARHRKLRRLLASSQTARVDELAATTRLAEEDKP